MTRTFIALGATLALALGAAGTAAQAQNGKTIAHNPAQCAAGAGPSVMVTINGVSQSKGTLRVQSYRATSQDWLNKGRWINRIELPARAGTMRVCVPLPAAGHYGIAVRHDLNNNGKTDLSSDGGAMSNNPSINIFNLGKPSYKKVGFDVGNGAERISIAMRYM